MLDFSLTDEQKMMVDSCRKLIRQHVIEPRVDMKLDQSGEFPHDIFKILWDAGMLHLEFPESAGGPGLSCVEDALIQEEIAYGCVGMCTSIMANSLAALPIIVAGHAALAKKY